MNEKKQQKVEQFTKLIEEYPIIAAVNMENLPSQQLATMRGQLRSVATICLTKRRLLKLAIVASHKPRIDKLVTHLKGMPALMFTKENPFKLYKTLERKKSPAPAKPGQIAPRDISIPAGPTPFAPGPVIGELGALGLKTGIEGGKVTVKEEKIVVKEGAVIKPNVASMLLRFGITPMEIGLNVTAVYENGTIFTKDVLSIDEEAYKNNLSTAYKQALNLAVDIGYLTKESVTLMIQKSSQEAYNLAMDAAILTKETTEDLLAKAQGQMQSIAHESKFEIGG